MSKMGLRGVRIVWVLLAFLFVSGNAGGIAQGQAKTGSKTPPALKKKPVPTTLDDLDYETFRKANPYDAYLGPLFPLLPAGKTEKRLLHLTGANASPLPIALRVTPILYKTGEKPEPLPAFERVLPRSLTSQQNYTLLLPVPNLAINATVEFTLLLHRKSEALVSLRETFVVIADGKAGTRVQWLGRDDKTQGDWPGVYGKEAFLVATQRGRSAFQSPFITLDRGLGTAGADNSHDIFDRRNAEEGLFHSYAPAGLLPDKRLPQSGPGQSNVRPPAAFAAQHTPLIFRAETGDGLPHTLSLYVLDYGRVGQIMQADVYDFQRHRLATQKIENFGDGAYLRCRFSGKIVVVLTSLTSGLSPVVHALFVDP